MHIYYCYEIGFTKSTTYISNRHWCVIYSTENIDYGSTIHPDVAILNRTSNVSCHSVMIYDDEDVEPPETFFVNITATGPTQKFIDLIVPDTIIQIVDDDSELLCIQWKCCSVLCDVLVRTQV